MKKQYSDDEALVAAIVATGALLDEETFGQLLERCHVSIKYVCRRYDEEYDEFLNVLFMHLQRNNWSKLKKWKGDSSLKTWLRAVIVNLALDRVRKENNRKAVTFENMELEVGDNVDARLLKAEQSTLLLDAIAKLVSDQRYAITRYYFDGANLKVIGDELGKKANNVKQILMNARKNLRDDLGGVDNE